MRNSKKIKVGSTYIGGGMPVSVQSMLSVPHADISGNVAQAQALEEAGCDIVRVAVPNLESVALIPAIKEKISIPLVADIHFDYRIALASADAGVDKIRINPGNIGSDRRVEEVAKKCAEKGIPIRIGVNSGSVEKSILEKYGSPTSEALCESALYHASLLEKYDFNNIIIAIKSSSVPIMINAYKLISQKCDYPLHLGVTEAGTIRMGTIKSAIGIGSLLNDGIGDTIRVSLTADPVEEVAAGIDILKALNLRGGIRFISCPTCGRTSINLMELAKNAEKALFDCKKDITVAIMGCIVNGPGESKEADIGIAGGDGVGLIFKKGKIFKKVPEEDLLQTLVEEVDKL